jgi:photosynthetic reaction center H subunit
MSAAITGYFDFAQLVLYVFWLFFAALIYYLHRENKREGYPLESDRSPNVTVQGWPAMPTPKTYLLHDGSTVSAPKPYVSRQALNAEPIAKFPGAPLEPTGDPMTSGVGPGSWTERADVPDLTYEGVAKIVPLRAAPGFEVHGSNIDPRGLTVYGADGNVGGKVVEIWVDRSEAHFRYLEVDVPAASGARRVLLPINFTRISGRGVSVASILGRHFANVPTTRNPDEVTLLEEEKITAYFGAGTLYAEPHRAESLL